MALTVVTSNAAWAGETEGNQKLATNYAPMQLFHKPVWNQMLYEQASKWYLAPLLRRFNRDEDVAANTWYWAEKGKFYQKQTTSGTAQHTKNSTTNYEIEIAGTDTYFIAKDVVEFGLKAVGSNTQNVQGRITSVDNTGAQQVITVDLIEGDFDFSSLTTASFDEVDVSVVYNSNGECFSIRDPRLNTPDRFSNSLTKLNDNHAACDDGENQIIWFKSTVTNEQYWCDENWKEVYDNHMMQIDSTLIFGQADTFTEGDYSGVAGKGLIDFLSNNSLQFQWSTNFLEADFQEMLTELGVYSKYKVWDILAGPDLYREMLAALSDYCTGGGVDYGDFGTGIEPNGAAGINFSEYIFGGKKVRLREYEGFGDPEFLPTGGVDYRKMGLVLNLESGDISVKYKKRKRGGSVRHYVNYKAGPTLAGPGEMITSDDACIHSTITTHVGLEAKGLLNHGIIVGV